MLADCTELKLYAFPPPPNKKISSKQSSWVLRAPHMLRLSHVRERLHRAGHPNQEPQRASEACLPDPANPALGHSLLERCLGGFRSCFPAPPALHTASGVVFRTELEHTPALKPCLCIFLAASRGCLGAVLSDVSCLPLTPAALP